MKTKLYLFIMVFISLFLFSACSGSGGLVADNSDGGIDPTPDIFGICGDGFIDTSEECDDG
ncbi:hypothetical protein KJ708_07600, partial [bacterium]|nr:hypothetical protein [bacterium]